MLNTHDELETYASGRDLVPSECPCCGGPIEWRGTAEVESWACADCPFVRVVSRSAVG